MKIGIVLFSETGNTYSVARKIKENFKKHEVNIEKIEIKRLSKDRSKFKITYAPKIDCYDLVIFGSFTEGFKLTPVMKEYLESLDLKDKKTIIFITHFFPFKFLGGNSTLKEFANIINNKSGQVLTKGIINWSSKKRGLEILDLINNFKQFID